MNFVNSKDYKNQGVKVSIKAIKQDSDSFGDSLREIQELNIFKTDFLVVRGDIVTNINLKDAIKYHFDMKALEERKENKTTDTPKLNTIMTKLFLKQSQDSPLSHQGNQFTMLMDHQTNEILKY